MVALSDGRLSCIHTFYRNMTVLSWVNCYLKSVKFLFLLSILQFALWIKIWKISRYILFTGLLTQCRDRIGRQSVNILWLGFVFSFEALTHDIAEGKRYEKCALSRLSQQDIGLMTERMSTSSNHTKWLSITMASSLHTRKKSFLRNQRFC